MENTTQERIEQLLASQRSFFATQQTKTIAFRIAQLKRFQAAIRRYEPQLCQALWHDLHKSPEEAYLTEIGIVLTEIKNHRYC